MGEAVDAVVTSTMSFVRFVVADHRGEVAGAKCITGH